MSIDIHPVTADRWPDLRRLFGDTGGYDGCWCMFWRLPNKELSANTPDDNRDALERLVRDGQQTGLLGYIDGEPAGWCAVAPRPDFARVARTKALQPADPGNPAVWSVACFFVSPAHRRHGLAGRLLDAAVEVARTAGAAMVEGYPVVDARKASSAMSTGTVSLFTAAGFQIGGDVPASGRRTVVRLPLGVPA